MCFLSRSKKNPRILTHKGCIVLSDVTVILETRQSIFWWCIGSLICVQDQHSYIFPIAPISQSQISATKYSGLTFVLFWRKGKLELKNYLYMNYCFSLAPSKSIFQKYQLKTMLLCIQFGLWLCINCVLFSRSGFEYIYINRFLFQIKKIMLANEKITSDADPTFYMK